MAMCFVCFWLFFTLERYLNNIPYGFFLNIFLFYTTLALHDLLKHGWRVYKKIKKNDLQGARGFLSLMVGRDTSDLSRPDILRGMIESLSENLVDGVTAPLFYGAAFGLPGAFTYKMINTLDSLWGHQTKEYREFGFFAAKLDDYVNYIPSRLTAPMIVLTGSLLTGKLFKGFKVLLRDGKKHSSPNSGLSESAMAGVLGNSTGRRIDLLSTKNCTPYYWGP